MPLQPVKIDIWVAMSRERIIALVPIFCQETIKAQRYQDLILIPLSEQLNEHELSQYIRIIER